MRVLVDRSIVEAFVMGGRVALTQTFTLGEGHQGGNRHVVPNTTVTLFSRGGTEEGSLSLSRGKRRGALLKSAAVHSMGCGWEAEPYTARPSL